MKKCNRVKSQKDFQQIFQKKHSVANRQFVVYQLNKKGQSNFRIGISVSKKLGNAVVRNHLKRYIRQVMTEERERIVAGKDYVIIARNPCVEMEYLPFKNSLLHVLKKARAWESEGNL